MKISPLLLPSLSFLFSWFIYALILIASPVHGSGGDVWAAATICASFVLVAVLTSLVFLLFAKMPDANKKIPNNPINGKGSTINRYIRWAMLLAIVGTLLLWFDRVYIQGIDYSKGIAAAREAWNRAGAGRVGVSSIASVLGYLFSGCLFPMLAILCVNWERINKTLKYFSSFISLTLIAANSILIGGRSIIMLAGIVIISACLTRPIIRRKFLPGKTVLVYFVITSLAVSAVGYSLWVFSVRAETGGTPPTVYLENMTRYLGGEVSLQLNTWLDTLREPVRSITAYTILASEYLTHNFWTLSNALMQNVHPGRVTFVFIQELLSKLSLANPPEPHYLPGRFFSLPAAFWYDYGFIGVLISAMTVGAGISVGTLLSVYAEDSLIAMMMAIILFSIALLSPLIFAADVMYFPFMILGFLLIGIIKVVYVMLRAASSQV